MNENRLENNEAKELFEIFLIEAGIKNARLDEIARIPCNWAETGNEFDDWSAQWRLPKGSQPIGDFHGFGTSATGWAIFSDYDPSGSFDFFIDRD